MMKPSQDFKQQVERQAKRMKKAEREQPTLIAQTAFIGTLGLLLVVPLVGGAYLGYWLDSLSAGYSMFWTITLILVGLVVGALNVYLFIKE
jgi:ATP synthase protein I